MKRSALVVAALSVGLLSCGPPPTEIVVRVSTDLPQGPLGAISHIGIRVRYESSTTTTDRGFDLSDSPTQPNLPQDLGILPHNGNVADAVIVEVTASSLMGPLLVQTARAHFEQGHILLLEVPMTATCMGVSCGAMMFCGTTGSCSSWDRDPLPRDDGLTTTPH